MTVVELNNAILSIADQDFRVNQSYVGDVYDINTKENKFGVFVATPMTATRSDGGVITYLYNLFYVDRLTSDESNMSLVQTDGINVLKKVIDSLSESGIEIGGSYNFTIFKHKFDDWCAGAYVDINFVCPDMECEGFSVIGDGVSEEWINQQGFLKQSQLKTINGMSLIGEGNITIEGSGGITEETVDNKISQSLNGYATETWVENKGYLTEHQPLKTINGMSLIGEGNITIEGSGGITEETVDNKISQSLNGYATETWVEGKGYLTEHQSLENYALKSELPDLTNYATKSEIPSLTGYATENWVRGQHYATQYWVNNKGYLTEHQSLENYALKSEIPSLTGYATEEWVNEQIISAGGITEETVDNKISQSLTGYATETWVEGKGYLTEHQSLSDYALKSELPDLTGYATKSEIPSLTGYATEEWVNNKGYLTEHQSLANYALKSEIPSLTGYATQSWVNSKNYATKSEIPSLTGYATQSWVESKGYLTEHQSLANYATKIELNNKLDKTSIWTGTQAEWDALSDTQKSSYIIALVKE